jgi:hypothetical protein
MKQTLIEQFVIECGKYGDTAQIPDEVIERFIKMEKDNIEQAELDAKEIVIIKQCAEQSTKAANQKTEAFAIGYDQGYNRALDLVEWKIKHELKNTK